MPKSFFITLFRNSLFKVLEEKKVPIMNYVLHLRKVVGMNGLMKVGVPMRSRVTNGSDTTQSNPLELKLNTLKSADWVEL